MIKRVKTGTLPVKKTIRNNILFTIVLCLHCVVLFACGPYLNTEQDESQYDLTPPVFLELLVESEQKLKVMFNEPASITESGVVFEPGLEFTGTASEGNCIRISVTGQVPGKEYSLTAACTDDHGNTLHFIASFHGFNPQIPAIIINEFTTQGSGTHPDLVELKVLESGNMGGLVFYQGTYHTWDDRHIFPAFPVKTGDFLLLHCKPQGIPEEIDETTGKDISGGLDASPYGYDFWLNEGSGISGNNGVLTLYESPGGRLIDGVLYSNRTSESDERYLGFGTRKVMERAIELASIQGWKTEQREIRPEDGINPEDSTATRSLCRNIKGTDTDTRYDWHIVPTRKSTFGSENCEEVWE